jgi:general L-amino acid transport system permease protein
VEWTFLTSNLQGEDRDACTSGGACWVFIKMRFAQFMYGFYTIEERWRVDLTFALLVAGIVPMMFERMPGRKWLAIFVLFIFPVIAFFLLVGGSFGLPVVDTSKWGGLSLTLVIAIVGIVASLPIGVVLALGRRSDMPVVRSVCIVFIEFWRGVPLITVLFMASVMFPLLMPEGAGATFDKLLRALIGVALFSAAYMAEVVRGGLQAIPKGQYEAAQALGLGYWKMMGLVVLPQALKLVIPGIVNTFIGLFKDTTLVLIIGLFDFLGIVQAAATNPEWLGFAVEGYVFCAFVYWMFCFSMSRYSMHLEHKLHTGHKR